MFFLAGDDVEQGSIERTETNVGIMGPCCVVTVFFLLVPRLAFTTLAQVDLRCHEWISEVIVSAYF